MIYKDEYIVTIEATCSGFPDNYIFKQRDNSDYLRPYLDSNGLNDNGLPQINLNTLGRRWRYAVREEIDLYNIHNKPNTIKHLIYKGDEVVTIRECRNRDYSYSISERTMLIVEDVIISSKCYWLYFKDIPGIFERYYFEKL